MMFSWQSCSLLTVNFALDFISMSASSWAVIGAGYRDRSTGLVGVISVLQKDEKGD